MGLLEVNNQVPASTGQDPMLNLKSNKDVSNQLSIDIRAYPKNKTHPLSVLFGVHARQVIIKHQRAPNATTKRHECVNITPNAKEFRGKEVQVDQTSFSI